MKTTVVNKRFAHGYDVDIGRPNPLGNPFIIGLDGTREEVVAKHKKYFLESERLKKIARETCRGKIIGCYCKPKTCHGDTIAEYLNDLEETEI